MKPETAGWVEKAEADFISAGRDYRARKSPNFDSACFHAQQSAEKYFKAVLTEAGIAFPRVHSLTALLHLILPIEPAWIVLKPEAAQLTIYAVEFRYPGKTATRCSPRKRSAKPSASASKLGVGSGWQLRRPVLRRDDRGVSSLRRQAPSEEGRSHDPARIRPEGRHYT